MRMTHNDEGPGGKLGSVHSPSVPQQPMTKASSDCEPFPISSFDCRTKWLLTTGSQVTEGISRVTPTHFDAPDRLLLGGHCTFANVHGRSQSVRHSCKVIVGLALSGSPTLTSSGSAVHSCSHAEAVRSIRCTASQPASTNRTHAVHRGPTHPSRAVCLPIAGANR